MNYMYNKTMNNKPKKSCPFCGKYSLYSDIDPMHTKRWVVCANCGATGSRIDYENIPDGGGWDIRPLEEDLQKEMDGWRNTATVLSVKLKIAIEALKGISMLWHGRGLAPKVLEELDKTIAEIEGE